MENKTINSTVSIVIAAMLLLFSVFLARAEDQNGDILPSSDIGTFDIIEYGLTDVFESSCGEWCFVGICFWLKCTIFGCDVNTTVRVRHRNPDVVVSTYRHVGENPWEEMRELWEDFQVEAANTTLGLFSITDFSEAQGGENISTSAQDSALIYREVDAIGHPINLSDISDEWFCGSQTTHFEPVFMSSVDGYSWRLALPEFLYILNPMPGMSTIGTPFLKDWGNVYRRHGFTMGFDEPVVNAQMAQRVGSIITRNGQPHLYNALTEKPNTNQRFFKIPPPLTRNSSQGGVWQMLSPERDESCYVFGGEKITWVQGKQSFDGGATWMLWRPYDCCKKGKGSFLFSIETHGICI